MLWYGYCLLPLNPLYCLYVMSNTLYKDHGVFLFFFFLVSSQPATRVRATDALRTVLVITTTLTLPACHMHKRTATERMVRFSPVLWFLISLFLVLVSHYSVIRVLFTVLESFVLRHLLKSYSHVDGEQNTKSILYLSCRPQRLPSPTSSTKMHYGK